MPDGARPRPDPPDRAARADARRRRGSRLAEPAALALAGAVCLWGLTRGVDRDATSTPRAPGSPATSGVLPAGAAPTDTPAPIEAEGCHFEDRGRGDYQEISLRGGTLWARAPAVQEDGAYTLLVHFHAGGAVRRLLGPDAWDLQILGVDAGNGSGAYRRLASSAAWFPALLEEVDRAVGEAAGRAARAQRIVLSSFSAGYGAVAGILERPPEGRRVAGVILLDSLHASLVPAPGGGRGRPDPVGLAPFVRAAGAARAEGAASFFALTHTAIGTDGYASTTESAEALLASLGLRASPVGWAGESAVPVTSQLREGRLVVRGHAGTSKEAHCDQLRLLPGLLRELLAGG